MVDAGTSLSILVSTLVERFSAVDGGENPSWSQFRDTVALGRRSGSDIKLAC
jgi:hypothetical protein